jgi:uncharacterized DUF497 family protein
MKFEWDQDKSLINKEKHAIDFLTAQELSVERRFATIVGSQQHPKSIGVLMQTRSRTNIAHSLLRWPSARRGSFFYSQNSAIHPVQPD